MWVKNSFSGKRKELLILELVRLRPLYRTRDRAHSQKRSLQGSVGNMLINRNSYTISLKTKKIRVGRVGQKIEEIAEVDWK